MMENLWTLRMPKENPCTNQWLNQTPTTSNKQITLNPKSKSRLKSQNNLLLKNPQQPNLKPPTLWYGNTSQQTSKTWLRKLSNFTKVWSSK
jgi:hypothetical protein